jgi:hypothetical protein
LFEAQIGKSKKSTQKTKKIPKISDFPTSGKTAINRQSEKNKEDDLYIIEIMTGKFEKKKPIFPELH